MSDPWLVYRGADTPDLQDAQTLLGELSVIRWTRFLEALNRSRHLSPFDPMLFAMFGVRAIALVRLGRFDEAADWGIRAATRPNANAHIQAIAAFSLALAGRRDEARARRRHPQDGAALSPRRLPPSRCGCTRRREAVPRGREARWE